MRNDELIYENETVIEGNDNKVRVIRYFHVLRNVYMISNPTSDDILLWNMEDRGPSLPIVFLSQEEAKVFKEIYNLDGIIKKYFEIYPTDKAGHYIFDIGIEVDGKNVDERIKEMEDRLDRNKR